MKLLKNTKTIIIAILLLGFQSVNAQWVKKYYVDDFGDPTTDGYETFMATGTFSNSATTNSECAFKFVKDDTSLMIHVYEYQTKKANSIEATFESIKLKTPSGNIETIKKVFFTKSGSLYFSKEELVKILDVLSEKGSYTMIFERTSKYSNSSYKAKFSIK
jgi:hypothetical protein